MKYTSPAGHGKPKKATIKKTQKVTIKVDEPRKRRGFPGTFNGTRYCLLKKAAFPKI
jgi:hypothetical protein